MKTVWRLITRGTTPPEAAVEALRWVEKNRRLTIGWGAIGCISAAERMSVEQIEKSMKEKYPSDQNTRLGAESLHDFRFRMKLGDLVILSVGDGKRRMVMEVTGPYEWVEGSRVPPGTEHQHQRAARFKDIDADELWVRAGGEPVEGQFVRRTLVRCAACVGAATLDEIPPAWNVSLRCDP